MAKKWNFADYPQVTNIRTIQVPDLNSLPDQFFRAKSAALNSTFRPAFGTQSLTRLGAVIYSGRKCIASSFNIHGGANSGAEICSAFHAEQRALKRYETWAIRNDIFSSGSPIKNPKATIYVARIGVEKHGLPFKMAKPCFFCMREIIKFGIGKIYYSISNSVYGEIRLSI